MNIETIIEMLKITWQALKGFLSIIPIQVYIASIPIGIIGITIARVSKNGR